MSCIRIAAAALLALAGLAACPAYAQSMACTKPFQKYGTISLPTYYSGATGSVIVPAGFRLKIEYISASVTIEPSGRPAFQVGLTGSGGYGWFDLPVSQGYNVYDRQTSQAVSFYAEPNSVVNVTVYRGNAVTTATTGRYMVSGCLIPV
ncbi:MAG: hypothetical protein ABWX87_00695 [Pseudoxanthomonas sp.]|jgi:hypothetical protein